jgi:uncharacterized protein with GYD domain
MPRFVILGKLTFKALEAMEDARDRDIKGEKIIEAAGGKLLAHYYMFGHYDFIVIAELPSNEALVKVLLEIGKWGTVSTETLTALTPEEVYKVAMKC